MTRRSEKDKELPSASDHEEVGNEAFILQSILSDDALNPTGKVTEFLKRGIDWFGMSHGYLAKIDTVEGTQTVTEVTPPHPNLTQGTVTDLASTYCRMILVEQDPLVIEDATAQGWADDPAFRHFGFSGYLGTKVVVAGQLYGTLCFVEPAAHEESFKERDLARLELISRHVARVLGAGPQSTDLRKIQHQLERTETLLHYVQEVTEVGGWELDLQAHEFFWTPEVYDLFEWTEERPLNLDSILDRLDAEAHEKVMGALHRSVMKNEPFAVEAALSTDDGDVRWVEMQGLPYLDEQSTQKIVGTLRDVTARRTQEREIRQAYLESLHRLGRAAEYRDFETGAHIHRVGKMARLIAATLDRDPGWEERMREAAPLHDVGKIGIPDKILLKSGPLSEEEFNVMKQHTLIGADLLSGGNSKLIRLAECIARSHHERWNGAGYPDGLEGTNIPTAARIVAVADAFDAMTHDRPYRRAKSVDRAFNILEEEKGRQFDPAIVDTFLDRRSEVLALL